MVPNQRRDISRLWFGVEAGQIEQIKVYEKGNQAAIITKMFSSWGGGRTNFTVVM